MPDAVRKLRSPNDKPITIRAVHPNAGIEAWYRSSIDEMLQAAHIDLALELSLTWNKTPPKVAADASPTKNIEATLKAWAAKWRVKFDKMSERIATEFTRKNFHATEIAMRSALKQSGFAVKFMPSRASIESYRAVVAENIALIKSIPQQYHTDVQTAVWQSVNKGADMATLSRRLQRNYGVATSRAALIARDQNAKAKAVIENTRRQQLGITHAIWQHSAGGKEPRPTHVKMNGQPFELARGMYDSAVKQHILPGELINCRCTSRAIIPGAVEV